MIIVKGLVDREKGDFYILIVVADDGGFKVDFIVVSGFLGESFIGVVIVLKYFKFIFLLVI